MAGKLAGWSAARRASEVFAARAERQGAYDSLEGGKSSAEALGHAAAYATVQRCRGEDIFFVVERCIEVYRRPANGRYWHIEKHDEQAVIEPERYPDFALRVADILPAAK